MYPSEKHPSYGIFVKKFIEELDECHIEYNKAVMHKHSQILSKTVAYIKFYTEAFMKIFLGSYDVIYIHYASYSSMPVIAASHLKNLNVFVNLHGSDVVPENRRQESMHKYTKQVLAISNKVVVPSIYFKNLVAQKYQLNKEEIYVYPSAGIDKKVFFEMAPKEKERQRNKYIGIGNGDLPVFGMAGRISKDKGWDVFVEAISILKKKGFTARYVIVGAGTEEKELDNLIRTHQLENDINRLPLLSQGELAGFYNAIDYLVFPTKREGESLGLVAIEAMACGTPVISSDFAAPKYYVIDDVNGYKFAAGDAEDLANKMIYCVENENKKIELKKVALKTADMFDKKEIRKLLYKIFDVNENGEIAK